jgi:hypothetical protein
MPLDPDCTLMLVDKSTGSPMRCQRCEGLLVYEKFDELRVWDRRPVPGNTVHQLWMYRGFRGSCQSPPPSYGTANGVSRDGEIGRWRIPQIPI